MNKETSCKKCGIKFLKYDDEKADLVKTVSRSYFDKNYEPDTLCPLCLAEALAKRISSMMRQIDEKNPCELPADEAIKEMFDNISNVRQVVENIDDVGFATSRMITQLLETSCRGFMTKSTMVALGISDNDEFPAFECMTPSQIVSVNEQLEAHVENTEQII